MWNSYLHRYDWKRFATTTEPALPATPDNQQVEIPWPEFKAPERPTRTSCSELDSRLWVCLKSASYSWRI